MAKLTPKTRARIPKAEEGNPSKHGKSGSYPLPDKAHCASAKGFAAMHNAPASVKARINRICGKKKSK